MTIAHSRPTLGQDEIEAVTRVLQSAQLAQGPRVQQFERAMAKFLGVSDGVAVSSGTVALELALRALGIGPDGEVILPSYVCAAPWLAAHRVGAQARLVDIELKTFGIDPEQVRKAVTPKTGAIIVPHLFGLPADITPLKALGLPIIEDCAQTLGATVHGRRVGTIGDVTVCSFYATKLLCTGEGGMVLSDDERLVERTRALREYDENPALDATAYNYKMTDLQGTLGVSQLARLPGFLERRAAIAAKYGRILGKLDAVLPVAPEGRSHVFYRYIVRVPRFRHTAGALDDTLVRLEARGVHCRRPVFRPLHRYLRLEGFGQSEEAMTTALSIPIYPSMTDEEVAETARIVSEELS